MNSIVPRSSLRAFLTALLLLLVAYPAQGQSATVRMDALILTQQPRGWRVDIADASENVYSLQRGDILTAINGHDASKMGPLAVLSNFNAAFVSAVPVPLARGDKRLQVGLWRGEGAAPEQAKSLDLNFVSPSAQAPDFSLPKLTNEMVRLSSLRGRWVLISFWATWCTPCRQEAPILNHLADANRDKLTVLGLAVRDDRDKLKSFETRFHPAYTILDAGAFDKQPSLSYGVGSSGGLGSVPVNVWFDRTGE